MPSYGGPEEGVKHAEKYNIPVWYMKDNRLFSGFSTNFDCIETLKWLFFVCKWISTIYFSGNNDYFFQILERKKMNFKKLIQIALRIIKILFYIRNY